MEKLAWRLLKRFSLVPAVSVGLLACGKANDVAPVSKDPASAETAAAETSAAELSADAHVVSGDAAAHAVATQPHDMATPPEPDVAKAPATPWGTAAAPSTCALVVLDALRQARDAGLDGVADQFDATRVQASLDAGPKDIEAALGAYITAIRPTPRETAYLVNDDGTYHSPDSLWRDRAPTPAESEAIAKDVADALARAAAGDADGLKQKLAAVAPQHAEYRRLVAAAARYADLCANTPWAPLTFPRNKRVKGDFEDAVRARLEAEGFVVGDEPLADAVARYRRARQLSVIRRYIDEQLVDDLNIPCETRLATLRMNVKRWRHTAINPSDKARVFVNLASQELTFTVGDEERVQSRVVVGSSRSFFAKDTKRRIFRNATPILTDRIETVVINPDWNVPKRIARDEIEPAIAKDPEYLEKNHFRVIETSTGGRIYIQTPGAHNALGRLKVLFPNDEGVYLHDTPAKGKFQLPVRAASHGCVRVEQIEALGVALLSHDRETNPDNDRRPFDKWLLRSYTKTLKTHAFKLNTEIPVYFEYYTASVADVDGLEVVRFHPDIYNYDGESHALAEASDAPSDPADAAAP